MTDRMLSEQPTGYVGMRIDDRRCFCLKFPLRQFVEKVDCAVRTSRKTCVM